VYQPIERREGNWTPGLLTHTRACIGNVLKIAAYIEAISSGIILTISASRPFPMELVSLLLKPTTAGLVFRTLTWNHLVFGSFFYKFDLYSRNTGGLEMEHSSTSYLL